MISWTARARSVFTARSLAFLRPLGRGTVILLAWGDAGPLAELPALAHEPLPTRTPQRFGGRAQRLALVDGEFRQVPSPHRIGNHRANARRLQRHQRLRPTVPHVADHGHGCVHGSAIGELGARYPGSHRRRVLRVQRCQGPAERRSSGLECQHGRRELPPLHRWPAGRRRRRGGGRASSSASVTFDRLWPWIGARRRR